MDVEKLTDRLPVVLGALYLAAGVAETIRVFSTGDGGLAFWFGTLVGGGVLVLLGALVFRERPPLYVGLVVVGAVTGMLATMWTLVVPLLAITVIVLVIRRASREATSPDIGR
jgi:hypothetical protein